MLEIKKSEMEALRASGQFDAEWYRNTYPDVARLGMDPAEHYLLYGHRIQRDPGPDFNTRFNRVVHAIPDDAEPLGKLTWRKKVGKETTPNRNRILLAAHEVARTGDHELAIALAEEHLPDDLAYTAHILRANAAIAAGDEASWQTHVNAYLARFGTAPIRLEGEGSLFDRLSTAPLPPVTGGPLISVIMPAWNAEKTVRMAAQSILNQTWRNLELLIVDDASEDGTWAALQEIAASDDRVKILRNKVNVGPYVSKNIALMQAKGDWITGQDADDWAHPARLSGQIQFCNENQQITCMSGVLRIAGNGQFVRLGQIGRFFHDGACRGGLISLMIQGQYFKDVLGAWDPVKMAGDSELMHRIEKIQNKKIPQLVDVTILMLDNPDGLTNHPTLGHSEIGGVSKTRSEYKDSFLEWHSGISLSTARLEIDSHRSRFKVPQEMQVNERAISEVFHSHREGGLSSKHDIRAQVVIVTNTRFPGGNASSTLDELRFFEENEINYAVVHCPPDRFLGKAQSDRYVNHRSEIFNWRDVGGIDCDLLICRHPEVVTSRTFKQIIPDIRAEQVYLIKNNSSLRADGTPYYEIGDMVDVSERIRAKSVTLCPISPVMREELEDYARASGRNLKLSTSDWTPTFNLAIYEADPKPTMKAPFRIGRHGRDGLEKWHENRQVLEQVYPESAGFRIHVLGGAKNARMILGKIPANWVVHEFGAMAVSEYLSTLDAFVYFPHSSLREAFGRTIVEAMIAGVPVILPIWFRRTFGDLPIYCEPSALADTIERMSRDDDKRVGYLKEIQNIAIERFSSRAIGSRLKAAFPWLASDDVDRNSILSESSRLYRDSIMAPVHQAIESSLVR